MAARLGIDVFMNTENFKEGMRQFLTGVSQAGSATERMSDSMQGLWTAVAKGTIVGNIAGAAIDWLSQKMNQFVNIAVEASTRADELNTVVSFLGMRFGLAQSDVQNAVAAVRDYGIKTGEAQKVVAEFIRYQFDLGDAVKLARVAQDAAVLSQEDSTSALAGLLVGILRYNGRLIRAHGLVVNLADAEKRMAAELGKKVSALTGMEKAQAALNEVLAQGVRVAGLYAITMEQNVGKRMRSLPRIFYEAALAAGTPFLDMLGGFTDGTIKFLNRLRSALNPAALEFRKNFESMKQGLLSMAEAAGLIVNGKLGGDLVETMRTWGAIGGVIGDAFEKGAVQVIETLIDMTNNISNYMFSVAEEAVTWGANIVAGLIDGMVTMAVTGIVAAVNFIGGLISGLMAGHSPPKFLPDINKWGAHAFEEYLKGFTMADFTVLDAIQNPLKQILDFFADVGRLKTKDVGKMFLELSRIIDESLAAGGELSAAAIKSLTDSTAEFGNALVNVAKSQLVLAKAEAEVVKQEEALEALREKNKQAQADVANLSREYNKLARAGASDLLLKQKMKELNAAEDIAATTEKQIPEDEKRLKASEDALKPLREQLELQSQILKQMIELARASVPPKEAKVKAPKAKKGGAAETPLEEWEMPLPMGGMPEKVDKAFEELKARILAAMERAFKPITEKMDEWKLKIGTAWKGLIDVITGKQKPFAVGIELEGEERAVSDFELALAPIELAWGNFRRFWDENGEAISTSLGNIISQLSMTAGIVVGTGINLAGQALLAISIIAKENGTAISDFFRDLDGAITDFTLAIQDFTLVSPGIVEPLTQLGFAIATVTGTAITAGIEVLAEALRVISEVLKENGPEIKQFLADLATSSEKNVPTWQKNIKDFRDGTIEQIDAVGDVLTGKTPLGDKLKSWLKFEVSPQLMMGPLYAYPGDMEGLLTKIGETLTGKKTINESLVEFLKVEIAPGMLKGPMFASIGDFRGTLESWYSQILDIFKFTGQPSIGEQIRQLFLVGILPSMAKGPLFTWAAEWDYESWNAFWGSAKSTVTGVWESIFGTSKDQSKATSDEVLANMKFMEVENEKPWDGVKKKVTDTWTDVVDTAKKQSEAVHDTVKLWIEKAETIWNTTWDSIKKKVNDILNGVGGIISVVTTAVTTIYNKLTGWIPDVIAYFSNPDNLKGLADIGTKIIEGLVGGIVAGYYLIKNAIIAAVKQAVDEFKEKLKIFGDPTPSLVMNMQVGKPIAEGIAKGIRDNAGLISSAMNDALGGRKLMRSPMMASTATPASYSYSTRNFNQNLGGVNINNGMDLAQFTGIMRTMIRQEMRR